MPELPLVGDEFAGYRLRAVLGKGGMSTVYQAENPRLGNVIALKVLAPELASDDVFRTRFLEESRIAAAMNHPHVIPIHDMGSGDGLLYIAMRCVSGTDLRQMISKRGRLLPDTAVFLLSQAARALDAAHRRGLVHRDVKPGNLLVERGNDDSDSDPDHLYLADFGITKPAIGRSGLTSTGQFLGTIDYVAPEQIRGLSVLGMADQYSLGCVLYECLTGRVPFEKDLDAAIIWAHVEETPTRATLLRPDLPAAIDEVFDQVLAKQPGDRYASCREFMTAARSALRVPETAVTARPSGRRVAARAPARAAVRRLPGTRARPGARGRRGLIASGARTGRAASAAARAVPAVCSAVCAPDAAAAPLHDAPPPGDGPAYRDGPGTPTGARIPAVPTTTGRATPEAGLRPDGAGGTTGTAASPAPAGGWRSRSAAGIGITLGAWLGFPGRAASGQQPGAARRRAAASARTPATGAAPTPPTLPATSQKTLEQALALRTRPSGRPGTCRRRAARSSARCPPKCSEPYPGIAMAFFQNYSSPDALYKAYKAAIKRRMAGVSWSTCRTAGRRRPRPMARRSPGTTSASTPGRIGRAAGNGQAERGEPGRWPDVLRLRQQPRTREHHLDGERRQHAGRGDGITAPGRVELVVACPPQHGLQGRAHGRHGHGAVRPKA